MKYYTGIGSRELSDEQKTFIYWLACEMHDLGYTLRSGDADGADTAFQSGAGKLFETWIPWTSFAKGPSRELQTQKEFLEAEEYLLESDIIPWFKAMGPASQAFHGRNYRQVFGRNKILPEVCFYCAPDDLNGVPVGGTRTAVLVSRNEGIPTINVFTEEGQEDARRFVHDLKSRTQHVLEAE